MLKTWKKRLAAFFNGYVRLSSYGDVRLKVDHTALANRQRYCTPHGEHPFSISAVASIFPLVMKASALTNVAASTTIATRDAQALTAKPKSVFPIDRHIGG